MNNEYKEKGKVKEVYQHETPQQRNKKKLCLLETFFSHSFFDFSFFPLLRCLFLLASIAHFFSVFLLCVNMEYMYFSSFEFFVFIFFSSFSMCVFESCWNFLSGMCIGGQDLQCISDVFLLCECCYYSGNLGEELFWIRSKYNLL